MRRSRTFRTTSVTLPQMGWKRRQEVHKRSGWRCWFCGRDFSDTTEGPPYGSGTNIMDIPTVEHLIPQCHGGTSHLENLVTACKSCNTAKRYRTVEEYRAYLTSLTQEWRACEALRQLIYARGNADASVFKALHWIECQLPVITFWGEQRPLD
jgi:5-methylcytosine-specific restriction endonuclease McrA